MSDQPSLRLVEKMIKPGGLCWFLQGFMLDQYMIKHDQPKEINNVKTVLGLIIGLIIDDQA